MRINDALKKYSLIPVAYKKEGNVYIIDTKNGKYIYKDEQINKEIYNYLKTRNFDYIPKVISTIDESFILREYEENYNIPDEQKICDLINIVALLHNKTTHYKEVSTDYYDQLYSDLEGNIEYLNSYYTDLITIIETKVYMSPSEYTLAKNISTIFLALNKCQTLLEKWREIIKDKQKIRNVILHNNLNLTHFISNKTPYLISWRKAKVDCPIFDLYKLYKNHELDFNFEELFKQYEKHYPLKEDEKYLLYILLLLPNIIEFKGSIFTQTKEITHTIIAIQKAKKIIEKA